MPGAGYLLSCNIRKQKGLRNARLGVVPYFSSGIVERAKRERAWKSPHAWSVAFSRGVIFTRTRVSLVLLSLRKKGGLLVVYRNALVKAMLWFMPLLSQSWEGWISSSLIARKPRDRSGTGEGRRGTPVENLSGDVGFEQSVATEVYFCYIWAVIGKILTRPQSFIHSVVSIWISGRGRNGRVWAACG